MFLQTAMVNVYSNIQFKQYTEIVITQKQESLLEQQQCKQKHWKGMSIGQVCNITQSQLWSTTNICFKHFIAAAIVGPVSHHVILSSFY